jgi:hypothetical protein
MIAVVSVFAISVHIFDENTAHRLYVRYYGFSLPVFIIAVFDNDATVWDQVKLPSVAIMAAIVSVVSMAPSYYLFSSGTFYPFKIIRTDIPEISLLAAVPSAFYFTALLGMITIFIWLYRNRLGVLFYGYVTIPTFAVLMLIGSITVILPNYEEIDGTQAGNMLREAIQTSEHDIVLVAGINKFRNDQVRMYARSGNTEAVLIKYTSYVPDSLVERRIKWILTPDSLTVPSSFNLERSDGRALLYKRVDSNH